MFEESPKDDTFPAGVDDAVKRRLSGRLGSDAEGVLASPLDREPIGEGVSLYGELRLAARAEGCVTLSDLLLRRVRVGLTLPRGGLDEIGRIREVAQPELGWSDAEWDTEVADYTRAWTTSYGAPTR